MSSIREKELFKEWTVKAESRIKRSDRDHIKLSKLLYDAFIDDIHKNYGTIWKSLFVWIYRWKCCDLWENSGSMHILSRISEIFAWFNAKYFIQASNYLRDVWDKDIFHVLKEYNLIKNLDKDIESTEIKDSLNLWEKFSIWVFHTSEDSWYWHEEKYGFYELDSKWKQINLYNKWQIEILDAHVLDRNDESIYQDASWEIYNEYLDSPSWIALFYSEKPVACMSFYIKPNTKSCTLRVW